MFITHLRHEKNRQKKTHTRESNESHFFLNSKLYVLLSNKGFTITEIVVAVAIFAGVVTMMLVLFNYTLRINRRIEALRQASQGMRNFVEFFVKEVRNGQVDYSTNGFDAGVASVSPCPAPNPVPPPSANTVNDTYGWKYSQYSSSVLEKYDTHLGVININGERECFYWGRVLDATTNSYTDDVSLNTDADPKNDLESIILAKQNISGPGSQQVLNPANFKVTYLRFYIRPAHEPNIPYSGGSNLAKIQPLVTLVAKFEVTLLTGEKVTIPYQTTISSDDYGVRSN